MKMSITHGDVKASIFRADGEHLDLEEVLTQFVTPLLITAGFHPESISQGYYEVGSADQPTKLPEDDEALPPVPADFVYLGYVGSNDDPVVFFAEEDLVYFHGGWAPCDSFFGVCHYAARIDSFAHKHALEHYPQPTND